MNLKVSEHFYSIQGEGRTIGQPAYFLRLTGCNLLCGGREGMKASWICDTIDVWKKGKSYKFPEIIEMMGGKEFIDNLKSGAHLIVTGGEPMLQQDNLAEFFKELSIRVGKIPTIEIETNGTQHPRQIQDYVKFWNISPKLKNSGESAKKRIDKTSIMLLSKFPGSSFKFVVTSASDWHEIEADWLPIIRKRTKIILMPGADNKDDLDKIRLKVINLCMREKVRFSDRLHITTWNKKTGV